MSAESDVLGQFLAFADKVQEAWERAHRPAYAETCTCGATVEIGRDVPAVERKRMWNYFLGRHHG